jgi:hypothetical protein
VFNKKILTMVDTATTLKLKINDLDNISVILATKAKELRLVEKTFSSEGDEGEHKAVKRVISELA